MADQPFEKPREQAKSSVAPQDAIPDERAVKTEAAGKVEKGRKILEKAEKNQVSFEINKNNMDRWTVILDEHLKRALGDEYSSDHLFAALQYLRDTRFNGKNLFEAAKREVEEQARLTVNLNNDDFSIILDHTREMQEDRELIASDWSEFLKRKIEKFVVVPQKKNVIEPEASQPALQDTQESTDTFFCDRNVLEDVDFPGFGKLDLDAKTDITLWAADEFKNALRPGEGFLLSREYENREGINAYIIKSEDGRILLNGVDIQDIFDEDGAFVPKRPPVGKLDYVLLDKDELHNRFDETYAEKFRLCKEELHRLSEEYKKNNRQADEAFFAGVGDIMAKYGLPCYFFEIPYNRESTIGYSYSIGCFVMKTKSGFRVELHPVTTMKLFVAQGREEVNPPPPEYYAWLSGIDLNKIFPDIQSLGKEILENFERFRPQ